MQGTPLIVLGSEPAGITGDVVKVKLWVHNRLAITSMDFL